VVQHLNWFDYVIIAIVFISIVWGLIRGLLKEVISLFTWLIAFGVVIFFGKYVLVALTTHMKNTHAIYPTYVGILIAIFVAVLLIGWLVNAIVNSVIDHGGISIFNHLIGGVFGCLRGLLIAQLLVLIITMTHFQSGNWFEESQLSYEFQKTSVWIQTHLFINTTPFVILKKHNQN